MDKLYFGVGMVIGFSMMMWTIALFCIVHQPEAKKPSWYGTYYSLSDALEDGWYEENY